MTQTRYPIILDPARRRAMLQERVEELRSVALRIVADAKREQRYAGLVQCIGGPAHVIEAVEGGGTFLVPMSFIGDTQ